MSKYDDIINLPHPVSKFHKQMSMHDRAAQFSPYAALTGYEDVIEFQNRIQETYNDVAEDKAELINEVLNSIKYEDIVKIQYYDKERYRYLQGTVKKISLTLRYIIVEDKLINFQQIKDITIID